LKRIEGNIRGQKGRINERRDYKAKSYMSANRWGGNRKLEMDDWGKEGMKKDVKGRDRK
jgi:hypothetical protein